MRKTKIVCTIGPATESFEMIMALIKAGMDVVRLNFSHGTLEEQAERIKNIRAAEEVVGRSIAILMDIQGPKIRIGDVPPTLSLIQQGDRISFTADPHYVDENTVYAAYPKLASDVHTGSIIYLDDGLIELKVEEVRGAIVRCIVVVGGELKPRKGMTLPGVDVDLPPLGERDLEHIQFGVEHGCDYLAASFVRKADHVNTVREAIRACGGDMKIIAKIESGEGVRHIDEIVAAADGVMVARGDMGIELPPEDVPLMQKLIIARCNAAGKPVITATQMLDSMIRNPRPTRAEVTDVANAILDGTDAVMLSGETAVGKYPIGAVATMHRIAQRTEESMDFAQLLQRKLAVASGSVADAIARATCDTALNVKAAAVLCSTQSGATARLVSKYGPQAPVVALTPLLSVARQLALVWGVYPILVPHTENIDDMIDVAICTSLEHGLVNPGDTVAIVAGVRTGTPGSTNMLQVHTIPTQAE
ncbi:MAG TPA: pyruvate kinase [Firmicutes bacterium]|jgi:pyruvate kinase|nr:pyruvate kinase [Bacillota bacterium]